LGVRICHAQPYAAFSKGKVSYCTSLARSRTGPRLDESACAF
jgi:hypothetical protein